MQKVKLGDVAREYKGTLKTSKKGLAIVGLEHLISENINLKNWDNDIENTFTKVFVKGTTLFGRRRAYLKKAVYAHIDGICSGDITVIEAIPGKILPELLPFVIQEDHLFDFAVGKSAGSLSPRVKWEHLKEYEFMLGTIDEQKELAKVLWSINNTIENYRELLNVTKTMAKYSFDKELSELEEVSSIKIKDMVKYLSKSKMDASLGKEEGEFPFFTSSMESIKWCDEYQYDDECIIMGNGGTASIKYYNGKFSTTTHGIVIKSNRDDILLKYVYEYLFNNMDILEKGFRGVGLMNIPKQYIDDIDIPVPSKEHQETITNMMVNFDKQINSINESIDKLKLLFKKISSENICKKEN